MKTIKQILVTLITLTAVFMAGCSTTTVRSTEQTPEVVKLPDTIPDDQLLDVGVNIFDPGTDDLSKDDAVFPAVRKAESRYIPNHLVSTLQNTGNWGVVRLVPQRRSSMDVWVDGQILESDGETLKLQVKVSDTSGQVWFDRTYQETASKYAYDPAMRHDAEPFQGLYNHIANDMAQYRKLMAPGTANRLRTISELKFARDFAPDAFSGYLKQDNSGHVEIVRLPAKDDPLLARIQKVRERDNLFVDTMQDYYTSFTRQMSQPYYQWRQESYKEVEELKQAQSESAERKAGGILLGLASIAAIVAGATSGSSAGQSLGMLGGMMGGYGAYQLYKSGMEKNSEAKMHLESLKEIAQSLDAGIKPHTVQLEDRTVTLTGTVDQQYSQWRDILHQIYTKETGGMTDDQATGTGSN